jgi:hypothetical protein
MTQELPTQVQKLMQERDAMRDALKPVDTAPPADTPQDTAPAATPLPQASEDTWEARFNSLQGKYTAEVPRLHSENRQLQNRLAALEQQMAEAPKVQTPAPVGTTPTPANPDRESLAAYGEEFGQLMDLLDAQKQEIANLKQHMATLQGNVETVGQTQVRTAQERFWDALSEAVPDYALINEDPKFVEWLNQPDGLSDMTRKEIGDKAFATLDAQKAVRVFKEFKALAPTPPPPPAPKPSVTPPTVTAVPDPSVHSQQQVVMIRKADVDAFYDKMTRREFPIPWQGGWVKDDMEATIVRAELQRAAIEGRIEA